MQLKKIFAMTLTLLLLIMNINVISKENEANSSYNKGLSYEEYAAEKLYSLGLFKGTDNGFELESQATRAQAAVMLCRLLGTEKEALMNKYKHPFKDVPDWANYQVGWLYTNQFTNGVGSGKYGSDEIITGQQYLSFLLSALGYKGKFTYESTVGFSIGKGLISTYEGNLIANKALTRGDIVKLSYGALWTDTSKNKKLALTISENSGIAVERFIENGVPLTWMHPVGYLTYENYKNIDKYTGDFVKKFNQLDSIKINRLSIAVKNLISYTPGLTPEEVMKRLNENVTSILYDFEDIGPEYKSETLTVYLLTNSPIETYQHELMHSISDENTPLFWQGYSDTVYDGKIGVYNRTLEGLNDLYAKANNYIVKYRRSENQYAFDHYNVDEWTALYDANYSHEQGVMLVLHNALGRKYVSKAFLGNVEDFRNLEKRYNDLTGEELSQLIKLANRYAGNTSTYSNMPVNRDETSRTGQEFFDAIIEICQQRANEIKTPDYYVEMDSIIRCAAVLCDKKYMDSFFNKMIEIRDNK